MAEPNPPADALAKQLKDSLARRRLRPWKVIVPLLVGSILLLALLAWWLYPRPKLAPLQIVAFDAVCTPEETPRVVAQLLPPPDQTEPRRLDGRTIVFHEQQMVRKPNEKPREIVTTSDIHGQASVEWRVDRKGIIEFMVIYNDPQERESSPHERGRIFVWDKDLPLLIVDADETLIAGELDANASATLIKAEKTGWRIVYLCLASTTANDFREARSWISKHQAKLPMGPVLGRAYFAGDDTIMQARREVLQSLQGRFRGKTLALVKNAESAQVSKDAGFPTIRIGDAATPTWNDVKSRLE